MSDLPEQALAECQSLLLAAKCSVRQGLLLNGNLTAVSVLVLPDFTDHQFRQVQVVCHAAGHLRVDWERVGFWMSEELTGGNSAVVLDARGRSRPFRVRYADSSLISFRDPALFGIDFLQSVGPQLVSLCHLEAPMVRGFGGPPPPPIPEKVSADGLLTARAEFLADNTLRVEVETKDNSLREATVALEIRSNTSGTVLHKLEFQLRFKGGMYGECHVKDELLAIQEAVELFVYPVRP